MSARAVLRWVDSLVLLVHASEDETERIAADICKEYYPRVSIIYESNPVWHEMRHRQRMLDHARAVHKATHIAMVDADEVLTGNFVDNIRHHIATTPSGCTMFLPWLCLRGSLSMVHRSGPWGGAGVATAFLDRPECHWTTRDGYDFHHRQPMGIPLRVHQTVDRSVGLMHLQFVSDRRLRAKQALYKATEAVRWPGRRENSEVDQMYNVAVYGDPVRKNMGHDLVQVPTSWWAGYADLMQYVDVDQEPWQERELRTLVGEHGSEGFRGLDFFGVV